LALECLSDIEARGEGLPQAPLHVAAEGEDPLAWVFYTSGSTGTPKGAMFTERTLGRLFTAPMFATETPVLNVNFMPLSHIAGRLPLVASFLTGGRSYFVAESDLSTLFDDWALVRPTDLLLVPRVVEMLFQRYRSAVDRFTLEGVDIADAEAEATAEVRDQLLGGRVLQTFVSTAPLAAELGAFLDSCLDLHVGDLYGLTEVAPVIRDGIIARPSVIDYKLIDVPELGYFTTDKPYPRGELLVKSENSTPGYYKRPEVTAEAFDEDGYYRTGDIIARQQSEASSKEKVLQALGSAAKEIRGPLGETVTSIERFSAPIEQATTSSLEALKAYAIGDEKRSREGDLPSLPFFKRAVELDPNFAMAYARIGAVYGNLGELALAEENAQKAFDLRDRTSELEKFYITAHYNQSVTGEVPKSIENYELWIQTYPRDWTPRNNVSGDYQDIGEFQKAVVQGLECLRLQPNDVLPYQVVMGAYIRLNQLEEAKSIYKQAVDKKLDGMVVHSQRFAIAYLEGDAQEMEHQAAWASGNPEESIILLQKAQVAASRGQLKKARELSEQAFDSARKFDLQFSAALVAGWRGMFENWLGDSSAAKFWSSQALDLSHDQLVWPAAALALAGDFTRPQRVIDAAVKRHPKNTDLQQNWIPQVRAAIEIKRANPLGAIEILRPAEMLEANDVAPTFYRGLAYLSMKSGKEAAAEFKKVVDRRSIFPVVPLHSISRLGLARSLALAGDTAGARSAYQDLFAVWKDADPDLPLLKQAKAEYERLH